MIRIALGIAAGALVGFLYYRFVGCSSGACPITSNPYTTMIFGALIGGMLLAG
ncbi:MAG: DUF6132 family protein [Chitinispirillaceae bacterium]